MYRAILSALLSISLTQLILAIPSIATRLEQFDDASYCRQIDVYREVTQPPSRTALKEHTKENAQSRWL